jgi:hypothetical protein
MEEWISALKTAAKKEFYDVSKNLYQPLKLLPRKSSAM